MKMKILVVVGAALALGACVKPGVAPVCQPAVPAWGGCTNHDDHGRGLPEAPKAADPAKPAEPAKPDPKPEKPDPKPEKPDHDGPKGDKGDKGDHDGPKGSDR